ncbi:MAG: hypothetical protein JWP91_1642 [Fibrobacteres bacterium]|nr:hypothetical protein [Fibrobacterota bacterium]
MRLCLSKVIFITMAMRIIGSASCIDTTLLIQNNAPGWDETTKRYSPEAVDAVNSVISGCTDATITVRLRFAGDTLTLNNEIVVAGRTGKVTRIIGENASANDSILTLVEANPADPQLLNINAGNPTFLSNLGFARKAIGSGGIGYPNGSTSPSVLISADSSSISNCHFWMADNYTAGTGALVDITASSVLVERCLFRTPPDGIGRSIGLHTGSAATRVEIRSSVFFSTGLQLAATGTVHVIANTFTGSRNEWNAIIIGSSVTTPEKNVVIQHNLFAHKTDTLPPIVFSGVLAASDSILKNAWSRGNANLPLAVNTTNAAVTLNGNSGANINTPLPRGFSNYGPSSTDVKDYPLTELRSDPTLARKNADFGKMFRVYTTSNWTGMSDIKDLGASKLYFPGFTPFLAGRTWLANVKVGAFVDQDTYETPSPLDSGSLGGSLTFAPVALDSLRIKLTQMNFDADYYKSTALTPEFVQFFFSDTLAKLTTTNDSNALKASVKTSGYFRKAFPMDDSILTVPKEVRLGSQIPFYVKMLHYRQGQQAPVLSNAAIATVVGVPSYPINDLTLKLDAAASDFPNGRANITVTRGGEPIDSVAVVMATESGQVTGRASKPAQGGSISFLFEFIPKGTFRFYAVPLVNLDGSTKAGQPTPYSPIISFRPTSRDTVYLVYSPVGCPGADGTLLNAYCGMDSALAYITGMGGGTIIVRNGNPAEVMEDISISPFGSADTSSLTITAGQSAGRYDPNRPIFRGKTREALTITRKNVTVKGLLFEMPAGSANAALKIKASGALVESNIFRAASRGGVEGPAVDIEVGETASARFVSNLVWGFTKNVQITNAASANVRVLNNTFVDDASLPNTGKTRGIIASGTGSIQAVFANNFFSGIADPVDATLSGKVPTLDHNVFTGKTDLRGLVDVGGLGYSARIAPVDIWAVEYLPGVENALAAVVECGMLSPCNPLYAGSSLVSYAANVERDVFGNPRVNRKEVGAFELNPNPSSVMGTLEIVPLVVPHNLSLAFVVTGKSYDPLEADSVHVYWSSTKLAFAVDPSLAGIPASSQGHFPIGRLGSGSFIDYAEIIPEKGSLYLYAALGRSKNGIRTLGYSYSDSIDFSGIRVISISKSPEGRIGYRMIKADWVRWLALDGRFLGQSRADRNGLVGWTPPPGISGLVLVQIAGQRKARAILVGP